MVANESTELERFPFKLEPIVPLSPDATAYSGLRWCELLLRDYPSMRMTSDWRRWYSVLPSIVQKVLAAGPFNRVSINVDTWQILDPEIYCSIRSMRGISVFLEWTEQRHDSVGVVDVVEAGRRFQRLRDECGLPIVLDDYGVGEDALGRLCNTRFDYIKLFGALFHSARNLFRVRDVLTRFIAAHEDMGVPVVIEWIETRADLQLASFLGASWGQGYLWSPPSFETGEAG